MKKLKKKKTLKKHKRLQWNNTQGSRCLIVAFLVRKIRLVHILRFSLKSSV